MTTSTTAYVPPIPDTDWTLHGDIYQAPATDAFWRLYRVGKGALYECGIRCTMEDRDWLAVYTPGKATPDEIERVLLKVDDAAMMEEAAMQRERAAREEEKRLRVAERERAELEWQEENSRRSLDLQLEAKQLLEKFGPACAKADEWASLIAANRLRRAGFMFLQEQVETTKRKIARFDNFEGFDRRCKYADWSAETVAASVIHLTEADGDQAAVQNGRGWSRADTSAGHYLAALLQTHYDDAVERARYIIGAYEKQLKLAGIL